jgi:hypothetical protein
VNARTFRAIVFFNTVARAGSHSKGGCQMIAVARNMKTSEDRFLEMLPKIHEQAHHAFRRVPAEEREELIREVIGNCWAAFTRLVNRGAMDVAYPTPLAQFAIKQVRDGRRIGTRRNINDVSCPRAQRRHGIGMERLDQYDERHECWKQILIEDRHAGPAETAAARIDIGDWLAQLPSRQRRIATTLASGENATNTARKHRVSDARISQLRREFERSWWDFQGEPDAE